MIPPRKPDPQESGVDSWLMSYADMITLLMCFFIIFVSVSEPKRDKFSEITQGLANKFGSVDLSTPFLGTFQALQGVVENNNLMRDVVIERSERSIDMDIASGSFFQSNSIEFEDSKKPVLAEMVTALKQISFMEYYVTIEVHTDDAPVDSVVYPSNWELSAARAARMARFFAENGVEARRIKAIGYADSRPILPNLDKEGRPIPENRLRNQRVIIKIERVL
ncbi:MAG: flagellar motor protein MotB [Rickettsiales bacterium]|nr:flagellar motor protein MotB [Rickettsiales bacterium]